MRVVFIYNACYSYKNECNINIINVVESNFKIYTLLLANAMIVSSYNLVSKDKDKIGENRWEKIYLATIQSKFK